MASVTGPVWCTRIHKLVNGVYVIKSSLLENNCNNNVEYFSCIKALSFPLPTVTHLPTELPVVATVHYYIRSVVILQYFEHLELVNLSFPKLLCTVYSLVRSIVRFAGCKRYTGKPCHFVFTTSHFNLLNKKPCDAAWHCHHPQLHFENTTILLSKVFL